jgi:hypothetical protein
MWHMVWADHTLIKISGVLSPKIRDQEQIWSTAQEEIDSLRSGYQTDQSDFCVVAGQTRV